MTESELLVLMGMALLAYWIAVSGSKGGKCPRCHGEGKVVTGHADAVETRRGVWNACEWTTERTCDICLGSGMAREIRRERDAKGREKVYYEPVREGDGK